MAAESELEASQENNPSDKPGRPWGFWATIAWSVAVVIGLLLGCLILALIFVVNKGLRTEAIRHLSSDGKFIGLVSWATAILVTGLSVGAASLKKAIFLRDYFAWQRPVIASNRRDRILLSAAFMAVAVWLGLLDPDTKVPAILSSTFGGWKALLILSLIVADPVPKNACSADSCSPDLDLR